MLNLCLCVCVSVPGMGPRVLHKIGKYSHSESEPQFQMEIFLRGGYGCAYLGDEETETQK